MKHSHDVPSKQTLEPLCHIIQAHNFVVTQSGRNNDAHNRQFKAKTSKQELTPKKIQVEA